MRKADDGATFVGSLRTESQLKAEGIPAAQSAPFSSMERLSMRRSIIVEREISRNPLTVTAHLEAWLRPLTRRNNISQDKGVVTLLFEGRNPADLGAANVNCPVLGPSNTIVTEHASDRGFATIIDVTITDRGPR